MQLEPVTKPKRRVRKRRGSRGRHLAEMGERIPTLAPYKRTKAGKIRLVTLQEMDQRTAAYRLAQERIAAIEAEEFDGQPTIRQHMAIVNDVLLSILIEGMGVLHLSGEQPALPRRLAAVVNSQRQERRSRSV